MPNSRITIFNADAQSAFIDYETDATDGDGRQVVVIGGPSIKAAVAEVASVDPGSTSSAYGQVVRLAGSASVQIVGSSVGSIAVHLLSTGGTLGVRVGQIDGSIAVHLVGTGGTVQVKTDPSSVLSGITSSIAVVPFTPAGSQMTDEGHDALRVLIAGSHTAASLEIKGTLTGITNSIQAHLLSTGGTLAIKIDPGYNVVNASSTISLPVTVSTTTSGVSASGVQVVAPEAGHNTKVFAYSVQTTGAVSMAIKFTNGAGTSPTEFWRPLVTASGVTGVQGANLAVSPPGYLFATGVNTTLAIVNDTASLIHYSVSYFKESA